MKSPLTWVARVVVWCADFDLSAPTTSTRTTSVAVNDGAVGTHGLVSDLVSMGTWVASNGYTELQVMVDPAAGFIPNTVWMYLPANFQPTSIQHAHIWSATSISSHEPLIAAAPSVDSASSDSDDRPRTTQLPLEPPGLGSQSNFVANASTHSELDDFSSKMNRGMWWLSFLFRFVGFLALFRSLLRWPASLHAYAVAKIRADQKWFPMFACEHWELEKVARGALGVCTYLGPQRGAVIVKTTGGRGKRVTENGLIIDGIVPLSTNVLEARNRFELTTSGEVQAKLHLCRFENCRGANAVPQDNHRTSFCFTPVEGADITGLARLSTLSTTEAFWRGWGSITDLVVGNRAFVWTFAIVSSLSILLVDAFFPRIAPTSIFLAVSTKIVCRYVKCKCCHRREPAAWDSDDSIDDLPADPNAIPISKSVLPPVQVDLTKSDAPKSNPLFAAADSADVREFLIWQAKFGTAGRNPAGPPEPIPLPPPEADVSGGSSSLRALRTASPAAIPGPVGGFPASNIGMLGVSPFPTASAAPVIPAPTASPAPSVAAPGFEYQDGALVLRQAPTRSGNGDRPGPPTNVEQRLLVRALSNLAPGKKDEKITEIDSLTMLAARHFRFDAAAKPLVLPDVHGKEFFRQSLAMCQTQSHVFAALKLPCVFTYRILLGFAKFSFTPEAKPVSICAGDFPSADSATFDSYRIPGAVERTPAAPRHIHEFEECARNSVTMFCAVFGELHRKERIEALDHLISLHKSHKEKFPFPFIMSVWSELHHVYEAQLRETVTQFAQGATPDDFLTADEMRLKVAAGSQFKWPAVFAVHEPSAYFRAVILPRRDRECERTLWSQVNRTVTAPPRAGAESDLPHGERQPAGGVGGAPQAPIPPLLPGGPAYPPDDAALTAAERRLSKQHSILDSAGVAKCFAFSCHAGCNRPKCNFSHAPITVQELRLCHPIVEISMLRFGGHASRPRIEAKDVKGHIDNIRGDIKRKEAANIPDKPDKPGKPSQPRNRAGAEPAAGASLPAVPKTPPPVAPPPPAPAAAATSTVAGWPATGLLPAQYETPGWTALETDMQLLANFDASNAWPPNTGVAEPARPQLLSLDDKPQLSPDSADVARREIRVQALSRVANWWKPWLAGQPALSDTLQSYVHGHAVQAIELAEDPSKVSFDAVADHALRLAADQALPDLAAEARQYLASHHRAGSVQPTSADIVFGAIRTPYTQDVYIKGEHFTAVDLGDRVPFSLWRDASNVPAWHHSADSSLSERNQCFFLHLALAVTGWNSDDVGASIEHAVEVAARIRGEWSSQAAAAVNHLGPQPPYVTPTEAEIRAWIHDELHDHHDRDYFSLLAFSLPKDLVPSTAISVICALPDGSNARLDSFLQSGDSYSPSPRAILCQNGHAKLLVPSSGVVNPRLPHRRFVCSSVSDILFNAVHEEPSIAATSLLPCGICAEKRGRAGTVPSAARYSLLEQLCDPQSNVLRGGTGGASGGYSSRVGSNIDTACAAYYEIVTKPYVVGCVSDAAKAGNTLVEAFGDSAEAVRGWRQYYKRLHPKSSPNIQDIENLRPFLPQADFNYLTELIETGADAKLPAGTTKLTRGPPLPSCSGYEQELETKLWKNARRGRVLLVTGERGFLSRFFTELVIAPWHRVQKMLPDRRISVDGRFCLSQTAVNSEVLQEFPSIWSSTLSDLARRAVHWAAQFPGIRRAVTLRDQEGAFPRIDVRPVDAVRFNAGEHSSWCPGVRTFVKVVAIMCTLSFGFTGSPAIHNVVSRAPTHVARSFAPAVPERDGPQTFDVLTKTDDHVMLEPDLGHRLDLAAGLLEESIRLAAGEDAVAIDKLAFNGFWADQHTVWGAAVDVNELTVSLPVEKRIKALFTVFDECYSPGNRNVSLVQIQQLQGSLNHWSDLQPALKPHSRAVSAMSRGHPKEQPYVNPPQEVWNRFWGAVDALRAWVVMPETHPERFCASMFLLLTPAERISYDAVCGRAPLIYGFDATPTRAAGVNFDMREGVYFNIEEFVNVLNEPTRGLPGLPTETIIALAEYLAGFVTTLELPPRSCDLAVWVTDNFNVQRWIVTRRAGPEAIQHLLLMLGRFEMLKGFSTTATYIRTYHNNFLDRLSRSETFAEAKAVAAEQGIKLREADLQLYADLVQRALLQDHHVLPREVGPLADELRQRGAWTRQALSVPATISTSDAGRWTLRESLSGTGTYTHSFRRLVGLEDVVVSSFVAPYESGSGAWRCLAATVGPESGDLVALLRELGAQWQAVVVDLPGRAVDQADAIVGVLRERGLWAESVCLLASRFGDKQARYRIFVIARSDQTPRVEFHESAPPRAQSICDLDVEDQLWVELDERCWHEIPRGRSRDEPYAPWLAGEFVGRRTDDGAYERVYVWSLEAAVPAITTEIIRRPATIGGSTTRWRGPLVFDPRGVRQGHLAVRMLSDAEVFRLQGSEHNAWNGSGVNFSREIRARLVQGVAPAVAGQVLVSALENYTGASSVPGSLAGGPKNFAELANEELQDRIGGLLAGSHTRGTQAGYAIGWRQWQVFCSGRDDGDKFLFDVRIPSERAAVENALIDYVGTLHFILHRVHGTVRLKLAAVRYGHLKQRLGDPTTIIQAPALSVALDSIRKLAPKPRKKLPVTPNAVRQCRGFIEKFMPNATPGVKVESRAIVETGFFYLCRQGEMIYDKALPERAFRVRDAAIKVNGAYISWEQAITLTAEQKEHNSVDLTLYFKSSKTDQDAMGALRTHRCGCQGGHISSDAVQGAGVCVVCTVIEHVGNLMQDGAANPEALLFPSFTRAKLSKLVKNLMIFAEGKETGAATDTHSLRIGGCTALYGVTQNVDLARRWGRWHPTSGMPFLYAWDVIGPSGRGVAVEMAAASFSLHDALIRATQPGAHPFA